MGLRSNVRWKARRGISISVNLTCFSLGVTAEALPTNIGSKSAILLQQGPVDPKFQVERVAPPTILLLKN